MGTLERTAALVRAVSVFQDVRLFAPVLSPKHCPLQPRSNFMRGDNKTKNKYIRLTKLGYCRGIVSTETVEWMRMFGVINRVDKVF